MKEFWDFDENKNYITINGHKVLNVYTDYTLASKLLRSINNIIIRSFEDIYKYENITSELEILLTTPFNLHEMQLEEFQKRIIFEGLNKPKNVKLYKSVPRIGRDGKLRAKNRSIFLTLRYRNNKLKSINSLLPLVSHELTHTALNHVTWKDDNHGKIFEMYDKMILKHLKSNI